ncbi:MAG: cupin domain-containing protein [Gaiellaceae bacterium MAG52_C11]|nr:cupin domain-containing protein [Candidatus Gaiellasilicea maunaloa]
MIHPGETLENPVTGEVMIFHRTSAQTNGEEVLVEVIVRPHGFVAAAHVHPYQTERFEVHQGRLGLRLGDEQLVATPGDVAVVNPGTVHRFWNAGDEDARFTVEVRPALQFESLIETMFTLAAEGKTNRKGMPNPLRLAVIARAHFDTVRLPFPPPTLQRAALTLGAPLGKALGYRETVTRAPAAATDRPHSRPVRTYERGRPHATPPAVERRAPR